VAGAFRDRYGAWALVAGASEGLGAEFAGQLAQRGLNLVLVARRAGPLEALAASLRGAHGVEVRTLARDLSKADDLRAITEGTEALDVGLVVCNAALAPIGAFLERTEAEHQALLDVNCRAAMVFARRFGPKLVQRGRGGLVFLSSLASLQGTALTVHYSASKAYLRVLAEGLWEELRPSGVDVLAVVAGPTHTPTWEASQPKPGFFAPPVQPAQVVVSAALGSLGKGPVCFPGAAPTAIGLLMKLLPTSVAVRMVSGATRKLYGR